jgi:hypothetical protein
MVNATVFFRLSPTGQKAAVLAGSNAAELQSITGPIPDADLDLCRIAPDGAVLCPTYTIWTREAAKIPELARYCVASSYVWGGNTIGLSGVYSPGYFSNGDQLALDASPASAAEVLAEARILVAAVQTRRQAERELAEERARKEAEKQRVQREEEIACIEAQLAADSEAVPSIEYHFGVSDHPVAVQVRERKKAAETRKKQAEVAREREKQKTIDAWIAENASPEIQEQHKAGLLCRKTAVSMIAEYALDSAGVPSAIEDPKVCDDSSCPCYDKIVECIPTAVYQIWKGIRFSVCAESPEFHGVRESAEFHEVRPCLRGEEYDSCGDEGEETAGPVEYHAVVTIPYEPFEFTRRIHLFTA